MPTSAAAELDENYQNYGSVDLNDGEGLPPDWKRDEQDFSLIAATIVGHENGKADAFKTKAPREKHQFSWVGRGDREGLAFRRMRGYVFVTDETWTKNERLWEWEADEKNPDGPRYCVRFDDRLMARPAALYFADRDRRRTRFATPDEVVNDALARTPGAEAAKDQHGNRLKPIARAS